MEVAFDERIPEETFEFTPPPGVEVLGPEDVPAATSRVTIEEAVARAPFGLWIAHRVPADWDLELLHTARPQVVRLRYRAADGTAAIEIEERPCESEDVAGPGELRLELEGTHVHIRSTGVRDDVLAELAANLVPAPSAPPTFG